MRAEAIIRRVLSLGGRKLRQKSSHVRMACRCGAFFTTVPDHGSQDVKTGTQRGIERDLEPCFGKGWLR